jgi:iron complex outermembrane receptor protein
MNNKYPQVRPFSSVCFAVSLAISASTRAAEPVEEEADNDQVFEELIVTGTRSTGVAVSESATPIQLISEDVLETAGKTGVMDALGQILPSFQVQARGTDLANQTLSARLRGMSPNHVLVLVDGKRRHPTGNFAVRPGAFGGNASPDLNFIPAAMIDHMEVLTDGAAAIYGSDAISGVINIISRKEASGGYVDATAGAYFDEGGQSFTTSGNIGFAPMPGAYLNLSAEYRTKAHSYVDVMPGGATTGGAQYISNLEDRTQFLNNIVHMDKYPFVAQSGDPHFDIQLIALTGGYEFANGTELYFNGTWGSKFVSSKQGTRFPHTISATYDIPGPTPAYRVYPYRYGFIPLIDTEEKDWATSIGVTGETAGWNWDLSTVYGIDEADVFTRNSINLTIFGREVAVAAAASRPYPTTFKNEFYDGTVGQSEWTSGLDVSRELNFAMPMTLAFGAEYRRNKYFIRPGEPDSYDGVGGAAFPGFSPSNATEASRNTKAVYANVILKPVEAWTVDIAGRYEDYSDFGDVKIGKFTTRYDINEAFGVRATYSNGFRAPSLPEEYYTSTVVGPTSTTLQIAPNSPQAIALLGEGLKPEKSKNMSFGFVYKTGGFLATVDAFQIKVSDRIVSTNNQRGWYGNGGFQGTGTSYTPADCLAYGNGFTTAGAPIGTNFGSCDMDVMNLVSSLITIDPNALRSNGGTVALALYSNGLDTTTKGIDVVLSYSSIFDFGTINWSVSGTKYKNNVTDTLTYAELPNPAVFNSDYNRNRGTRSSPTGGLFGTTTVTNIENTYPDYVLNFGAVARFGPFTVALREIIYGNQEEIVTATNSGVAYVNKTGVVPSTNLDIAWKATNALELSIGAQNLLDRKVYANDAYWSEQVATFRNGALRQLNDPLGINGGYYYGKVKFTF